MSAEKFQVSQTVLLRAKCRRGKGAVFALLQFTKLSEGEGRAVMCHVPRGPGASGSVNEASRKPRASRQDSEWVLCSHKL